MLLMNKFKNITQVSKELNLINTNTKKPANYILRYWEKEFKSVKPKIINKRRYYSDKQIETLKLIKSLLKDKGFSISGAKKILKSNIIKLDDQEKISLKEIKLNGILKKGKLLLTRIKKIKTYGKKNSFKD